MSTVSIIGNGNMAKAIGGVAAAGGSTVEYLGREGGAVAGDVVVFAVPYPEVDAVIATYGDALAGKIVVDITNPVDFATFDGLAVPADSSAAAVIAGKLPAATVLKAFNTNFGATLASGTVGAEKTTVLIAGDDDAAKATLAAIVTAGGLGYQLDDNNYKNEKKNSVNVEIPIRVNNILVDNDKHRNSNQYVQ